MDDAASNPVWENDTITESVDFDFDEVSRNLGEPQEITNEANHFTIGLTKILQWIRDGSNARAKEIRLQAAYYYVERKNQVELAREIGVKKATISQKAVELRDFFQIKIPAGAASQMRSAESRQTFSEVCTRNHQKRKLLSESTDSQTRLTSSLPKPLTLRARVLAAATQRLTLPSPAVNS